jgi:hypothetical protein
VDGEAAEVERRAPQPGAHRIACCLSMDRLTVRPARAEPLRVEVPVCAEREVEAIPVPEPPRQKAV